jgi:hypothetical protein
MVKHEIFVVQESSNSKIQAAQAEETQPFKRNKHRRWLNPLGSLWPFFALWLCFGSLMPSLIFAQDWPCAQELPGDFVVGRTAGEVVTVSDNRVFTGRIVVKNKSTLHFRNVRVGINGNVLICDNSTLRVDRSVVSFNMAYLMERELRAYNGSTFEFNNSFFIDDQRFTAVIFLHTSHLVMNSVNRTDLERSDLRNVIGGWATTLIDSSAAISDTYYVGEFNGLVGRSSLRFVRSWEVIIWVNFLEPRAGGSVTPPSTRETPISWRFDRNTPGVQGIEYSIEIENSRHISSGVIIWVEAGVPNADVTIRDGSAYIGLIFAKQSDVRIDNFREGLYTDFSPKLPSRRLKLERVRVSTWNVYASGSDITITKSEVGEISCDSYAGRTARVHVLGSRLTGNGGNYRANNFEKVSPPPTLLITDSQVYSEVVSSGGVIIFDSSRVLGRQIIGRGAELIADKGTIVALNSPLSPPVTTITRQDGTIWQASVSASVGVGKGNARTVTFHGDAAILSEGQSFSHYTIEYAPVSDPSERSLIYRSADPIRDGTLFTWRVPEDFKAGSYIVTVGVNSSSGTVYRASQTIQIPEATGLVRYSIQANGVDGLRTTGVAARDLRVGSTAVHLDPEDAATAGTAILSLTQNNALVTEAAMADSPVTTRARIFVDSTDRTSTGVAITNPSSLVSRVGLTLTSMDGARWLGGASLTIPPHGQIVGFVNDLIYGLPINFQGNLSIESEQPVAAAALKISINNSATVTLATLPVVDETASAGAGFLVLPHITDGGGTKTQIILTNTTGQALTGQVTFYSPEGRELPLTIAGNTSSQFPFQINPGAILTLTTAGEAAGVQVGYARIEPDRGQAVPAVSALFSSTQDQGLAWEAGYSATSPTTHARLFVELSELIKPGISIANPNDRAATVTLSLKSISRLSEIARATVQIPPRGQLSRSLSEVLDVLLSSFSGTLDLTSDQPLSSVGLRSRVNRESLLVTALPVLDTTGFTYRKRLVFPFIIDGGGARTQIMLMNPQSSIVSGSISFSAGDGDLLPIEFISLF